MTTTPTRIALVAGTLVAGGCGLFGPGDRDGFAAAQARWNDRGPSAYQITVQRLCFCGTVEPVRITVVDGVATTRTYVDSGDPVPEQLASYYPAVPGLFDLLADALRRADDVHATFDPELGFPTSIVIDYVKNAIDDELTVRTSDFRSSPSPATQASRS